VLVAEVLVEGVPGREHELAEGALDFQSLEATIDHFSTLSDEIINKNLKMT
jgi:hypothetical protein